MPASAASAHATLPRPMPFPGLAAAIAHYNRLNQYGQADSMPVTVLAAASHASCQLVVRP